MGKTLNFKNIHSYFRKFLFLSTGLVLKYPMFLLLFLLRPLRLFQYIFLIYPGKDKDIEKYCPLWLAKKPIFAGKPLIAGIITKSTIHARGLVLVIPNSTHDLMHHKHIAMDVMKNLNKIATIVGAHTIGMAGQGPGIMTKHNIDTGEKFMYGTMGTIFSISQTIDAAVKDNSFSKNAKVVVVGKSFISTGLVDFLNDHGYNASDINISEGPSFIEDADIVVVITLSGKLFYPFMPYLKDPSIVIDYTHPKMLKKPKDAYFYKVATGLDGVKFIPRLPGYKAEWIPGCCIESIVHAECGDTPLTDQKLFNETARSIGLKPLLVS